MESLGERLYVFKRFLMHYAMPHSFLDLGVQESLSKPFLSLVAQLVKNPPTIQETWVRFLGTEDSLEKGTHSNILARRIPWTV